MKKNYVTHERRQTPVKNTEQFRKSRLKNRTCVDVTSTVKKIFHREEYKEKLMSDIKEDRRQWKTPKKMKPIPKEQTQDQTRSQTGLQNCYSFQTIGLDWVELRMKIKIGKWKLMLHATSVETTSTVKKIFQT